MIQRSCHKFLWFIIWIVNLYWVIKVKIKIKWIVCVVKNIEISSITCIIWFRYVNAIYYSHLISRITNITFKINIFAVIFLFFRFKQYNKISSIDLRKLISRIFSTWRLVRTILNIRLTFFYCFWTSCFLEKCLKIN